MKQIIQDILNNTYEDEERVALLHKIMNFFPVGLVITYEDKFGANDKFYQLINHSPDAFHTVSEYFEHCPEDYIMYKNFPALLATNSSFTKLYPIRPAAETEYYVENYTFAIQDSNKRTYYVTTLSDHSSLNNLTVQFDDNNVKFKILEELMPDYNFEYNMTTDTLIFPERWKPDGLNTEYPHATKWLELQEIIHPNDLPFILDAMSSNRLFKETREMEFRAKFADESEYSWFRITYRIVRSKQKNQLRIIGRICNVDKEHMLSPNKQQDGVDARTGLFVTSYMESCVDQAIAEEPKENMCALMLLQLDNFAQIKKTTGDLYSRRIEKQVADKLKNSFRNTDILGYSRDGCYTIFLRKVPEHIITMRANHVLDAVHSMIFENCTPPQLSCSVGIGISPLDGSSYMDLFLKADSAMYLSKARGGNTFSYYNAEIDARQRKKP